MKGRKKLEREFKSLANRANKIISKFQDSGKLFILQDDYGATFHDKTIVNKSGLFKVGTSRLNMKVMDSRMKMMREFIKDSKDYFEEYKELVDIAKKMEKYQENKIENGGEGRTYIAEDLADFFLYAKSLLGETFDPSDTSTLQVAENMLNQGFSIEEVKQRFSEAVDSTMGLDHGYLLDEFARVRQEDLENHDIKFDFAKQGVYL